MAKYSKDQYDKLVLYRNYINSQIYTSPPVDVHTFITDPKYLGNSFNSGKTNFLDHKKGTVKSTGKRQFIG